MKSMTSCLLAMFVMAVAPVASAVIINIPDDYPTIQEGIDASIDGDTVLVQPGTYVENINFNGHNIVLGSLLLTTGDTTYIPQTIIDGDSSGSVVTFESGEDSTSVISGFTIRKGYNDSGGGIYCVNSSPIISNNIITENTGYGMEYGGGIYCRYSRPLITGNVISSNFSCWGGGIYCEDSEVIIFGNRISYNEAYG